MECREIMNDEVQWILPDQNILQAAKLMAAFSLGWLPVCGEDFRPIGVITDRDIAVRVVAQGRSPSRTRVDEVMTSPVHFAEPSWSLERAAELMSEAGVSRLVVLDPAGRLDGVISLADLFRHAPHERSVATALGLSRRSRVQGAPLPRAPLDPSDGDGQFLTTPPEPRNEARAEAEHVARGGTNPLKEFPG
jgi:CBS domain-containing protein